MYIEKQTYLILDGCEYKASPVEAGTARLNQGPNVQTISINDKDVEFRMNGKNHRESGPAVIGCYGQYYWYINGNRIKDNLTLKSHSDIIQTMCLSATVGFVIGLITAHIINIKIK